MKLNKNNLKSWVVVVFMLFILVHFVESIGTYYNPTPTFKLNFSKPVVVESIVVTLKNLSNSDFSSYLSRNSVSTDRKNVTYITTQALPEGNSYNFTIKATDDSGGQVNKTILFNIEYPPLDIQIVEPRFSVTANDSVDLAVSTARYAKCNLSLIGFDYLDLFETTQGTEHREDDVPIYTQSPYETDLYIRCVGNFGKVYDAEPKIIYDHVAPTISLTADDVTETPFETTLYVTSTGLGNEPVICRYSNDTVHFPDMIEFEDYDEDNITSYKPSHEQVVGAPYIKDNSTVSFSVVCADKSGRLSNAADVDVDVDTTKPASLEINFPTGPVSSTGIHFDISANKRFQRCDYKASGGSYRNFVAGLDTNNYVSSTLIVLSPGSYTYYVKCGFRNATTGYPYYVEKSTSFVIDNTAPNMTRIEMISPLDNNTGKTYRDDELNLEWESQDNESSVDLYAYYVYWDKTSGIHPLIETGTIPPASDNEYGIDHLSLNNSQKYYVLVQARNAVGLWGGNISSSSIQVDTSLVPAGCNNNKKEGTETDIDCGGSCPDCGLRKNCTENSDCASNYCNSSNKCDSAECDDNILNGAESDVDCGGNCRKCAVGKYCDRDSDCLTGNCDSSTDKCAAVLDTCYNSRLDPAETDVDCGGSCPGCGVGKNCDADDDCMSTAECAAGLCKLKPVDTDGDGVNDDVDNCPSVSNTNQADADNDDVGDACDNDADNDGLPDSFEQQYFNCISCANPSDDPDKDGLTNLDEYTYNTNPTKKDTDGDGASDKEEIDAGTDPLDKSSKPGGGDFWKYLFIIFILIALGVGGYFGYGMLKQNKKPFVPPKAPTKAPMRGPSMPVRRPMPMMRRQLNSARPQYAPLKTQIQKFVKPISNIIKPAPAQVKKVELEEPKVTPKNKLEEKKEDIFKKLHEIAAAEREEQVEKNMKSLKMTDKELKDRIQKLRSELKIPVKK